MDAMITVQFSIISSSYNKSLNDNEYDLSAVIRH